MLATTKLKIKAHEETTSLLHIKHNAEIEELKAQQEEHIAEIAKMHEHLQAYTERYASAGQRNTELEAQIQSLVSDLEKNEYALNQSKHQESYLANQTAELEKYIEVLNAAYQENKKKEHSVTQELLKLQNIMESRDSEAIALHAALANNIDQLTKELKANKTQLTEAYNKLGAIEKELTNTREHNSNSQAHANAREGELTAIQIALHDHIEKLSRELQEKNQELAERIQR
jgi:chromosome segregation ATPase